MNLKILIFLIFISVIIIGQETSDIDSFQDTIYYDANSGNYVIDFLGNSSVGELDSIITMTFVPGTKIDPTINAKVSFDIDSSYYLFMYKITNGPNSIQRLLKFRLFFNEDIEIKNKQTNKWHGGHYKYFPDLKYISWWGDGGLEPTWSTDGFIISSKNLPGIGESGMQGVTSILSYSHGFPNDNIEKKLLELSLGKSSFKLLPTVIPVIINDGLNSYKLLDIIKNYNNQSYDLGWIKDGTTYSKYNNYLTIAKTAIEQNDHYSAGAYLQGIIAEVDLDSSITLTSEAYALLKFNTEYLLKQLPEINIAEMFDALILQINQCYENEWIDKKGIYNSLVKKVENAQKSYNKGKTKTAINQLNAFINEVEAHNGKHLTNEAYMLLKYNSENLILKLKEE